MVLAPEPPTSTCEARIGLELRDGCAAATRGNASTSPDSSAATCAAGSEMKRIVTFDELDRGGVAIVRPFDQRDRGALGPGAELIGPVADRLRDIGRRALRLDDRAGRLARAGTAGSARNISR